MTRTSGYPITVVARRFVARTFHHIFRHPIISLGVAAIVAFLVLGGPALIPATASQPKAAAAHDDAADQYMRGMRDHDVTAVFSSLSPDMQHSLEQRTGARSSSRQSKRTPRDG